MDSRRQQKRKVVYIEQDNDSAELNNLLNVLGSKKLKILIDIGATKNHIIDY